MKRKPQAKTRQRHSKRAKREQKLLEKIKLAADEAESDLIVTTGKDWVKLGDFDFGREICYINQRIDLDPGEEKLIAHIVQKLGLEKKVS